MGNEKRSSREISFDKNYRFFGIYFANSFVFFSRSPNFNISSEKIAFCSGALLEFLHVDDYTGRPLSEKDEKWSC